MTYHVFTEHMDDAERQSFDEQLVGRYPVQDARARQPRSENVQGLMAAFRMGR